jgi:hypothetical protein
MKASIFNSHFKIFHEWSITIKVSNYNYTKSHVSAVLVTVFQWHASGICRFAFTFFSQINSAADAFGGDNGLCSILGRRFSELCEFLTMQRAAEVDSTRRQHTFIWGKQKRVESEEMIFYCVSDARIICEQFLALFHSVPDAIGNKRAKQTMPRLCVIYHFMNTVRGV